MKLRVDINDKKPRRRLPWSAHEILEKFQFPLEVLNDFIKTESLGQPLSDDSEVEDNVYDAISDAFSPTLYKEPSSNNTTNGSVSVKHALIALNINLQVLNDYLSRNKFSSVKSNSRISLSRYKIISQAFSCPKIHLGFPIHSYVVSSLKENPIIKDQLVSIGTRYTRFIKSPWQRIPDYSYKICGDGKPPIPPGSSEFQQKWFREKTDYYDTLNQELAKKLNQRVYKIEKYKSHKEADDQYCTLFATSSNELANNGYSLFYYLSKESQKINQKTESGPHCYLILTRNNKVIDYIDISDGLSSTNEVLYTCGFYKVRVSDQVFEVYSSADFNYSGEDKRIDLGNREKHTLELYKRQKKYAVQKHSLEELPFDVLYQFVNKAYNHVETFNIDRILNSLEVNVEESFFHRVGRDDYYRVDETRTVDCPVDQFITELFQLGKRTIYSQHGYCPAEDMRIPDLAVGDIEGDALISLRAELRQKYSKECHLKYLLSNEPVMKELLSNYNNLYNDSMASNLLSFSDYVDKVITNRYWTSYDELIDFFQHQS